MPNRVVQWSPFSDTSFASYDGKLKLFELVQTPDRDGIERDAVLRKFRTNVVKSEVTTIDWFRHESNPKLMAVGNAAGQVSIDCDN